MATDETVLDNLSAAESSGDLGYCGLTTPSPPASLEAQSPGSVTTMDNNDDDDSLGYPRIAHVQSVNIKVEPLDDNEDPEQVWKHLTIIILPFWALTLSCSSLKKVYFN